MQSLNHILKAAPELALFVALGLGQVLGRVKLASFSLGGVAGSLVVGLVIGQLTGVELPEALKAVCFALFIYSVGFKSGPEFFGSLNRSSLKLVLSSVVQCVVALGAIVVLAKVCGFSKGFAAGIGAGALTATAMMGTAGDALSRLGLTPEQMTQNSSQMAVAFAVTYVFGTVGELQKQFDRATIERVVRDDAGIEYGPGLVLRPGDIVGVSGRLPSVVAAGERIGDEVESKEALSFPVKVVSAVLTNKNLAGKTLRQVRDSFSKADLQGVYLVSLKRQSLALPILLKTQVRRGDVVELAGRPAEVDGVAAGLGFADTGGDRSDLAYHALAIVLGTLLGLVTATVSGIPITLGVGGGVLVAGLAFGWWHTRYPVYGGLPGPAQWILSEFGLSAFATSVGLSAGPKAIAAIQEQGVALLLAGAGVTILPLVVALYFGRFVLKLNPVVQLGALCGGQTVAAALSAVNEETESITPVLGFTVTYAISNVLLAVWGPLIVAMT